MNVKNFLTLLMSIFLANSLFADLGSLKDSLMSTLKDTTKTDQARITKAEETIKVSGEPRTVRDTAIAWFKKELKNYPKTNGAPTKDISEASEYKTAQAAYTAFSGDQTNYVLAQAFIAAYDKFANTDFPNLIKTGKYTGSIPGAWATLLTTAQGVQKPVGPTPPPTQAPVVDADKVKKENENAAKLADDIAAKIQVMPTNQLSSQDKKEMAAKWNNFSQQVIKDFGA